MTRVMVAEEQGRAAKTDGYVARIFSSYCDCYARSIEADWSELKICDCIFEYLYADQQFQHSRVKWSQNGISEHGVHRTLGILSGNGGGEGGQFVANSIFLRGPREKSESAKPEPS